MSKLNSIDRTKFEIDLVYRNKILFGDACPHLLNRFKKYHKDNPIVFHRFKELTLRMTKTGRARYSAWCIINKIRWDMDIEVVTDDFKISNDFIGLYARLLIYHQPNLINFFEIKPMKKVRA